MKYLSMKTSIIGLIAAGLLLGMPGTASADRWYNSKEAWTAYGFVGGAIVGHLLTREYNRSRQPQPVYYPQPQYGGYYGQPGYYNQPAYYPPPQDTYTVYKEDRVWPFYRRVRAESIPMIQPPPPGRSAARSLASDDIARPTTTVVNNYYYGNDATKPGEAPPQKTTEESVGEARALSTRPPRMEVVTVSNRAGQTQLAEVKIRERRLQISQQELEGARAAARDLQREVDQLIDRIGAADKQVQEQMEGIGAEGETTPSTNGSSADA
jgi:hypothetical protein